MSDTHFSHIFFADDFILFGVNNQLTIQTINNILKLFSNLSGLKINLSKSKLIFSHNSTNQQKFPACTQLQMPKAASLGMHLGFPITQGAPRRKNFLHIIDKMKTKLSAWKASLLTHAGKIVLIKSTLLSIPAYPMQMSKLPQSICKQIDNFFKDFLWSKNVDKNGMALVSWRKCCLPKSQGGLGFRRAEHINKSLQMKLGWEFIKEKNKPWNHLITTRYHKSDHLSTHTTASCSKLWKFISNGVQEIRKHFQWIVNSGISINLVQDRWVGKFSIRNTIHGPLPLHEFHLSLSPFISGLRSLESLSFSLPPKSHQLHSLLFPNC